MKKQIITHEEMRGLISKICRQIHISNWKPDYIVGIVRGGLTPAVMISQYLNIPMHTLNISLRDQNNCESNLWMSEDAFGYVQQEKRSDVHFEVSYIPVSESASDDTVRKNILIVDDINDSGATLNWLINDWQSTCLNDSPVWNNVWNNNVKFAVVVDNLASNFTKKIDFAGLEINKVENNVWIDFPWEDWWTK
jgi:hypoxanthine phosphoribosyltransferase